MRQLIEYRIDVLKDELSALDYTEIVDALTLGKEYDEMLRVKIVSQILILNEVLNTVSNEL